MKKNRRPILYKGEVYSSPIVKRIGGQPKEPITSFDSAKTKISNDIDKTLSDITSIQRSYRMPNEVIVCMRMQPEFSAKSYYPTTLFDTDYTGSDIQEIGSRIWRETKLEDDVIVSQELGKLLFVRTTEDALKRFRDKLNSHQLKNSFQLDVRKLSALNILSPDEQILGFGSNWSKGRIEAVIHPFEIDKTLALEQFRQIAQNAGASLDTLRFKQYDGGVTFVSMMATKETVTALRGYNPLRTLHPLFVRELPDITRIAPIKGLPKKPVFKQKSQIILGVLDGGYKKGNSYLDNYVDVVESVPGPSLDKGLQHGTLVTAAALYGPLNAYSNSDQLPEPPISVKNFRVISTTNVADLDLYESIDKIEEIVPANKNIPVYNLSFGPKGEILDDHISRFTFSLDLLSKKHNVLFCVAVGNDGEIAGYDRIQSPSDAVNGLGVGAYTVGDGIKQHAPYSCKGPGREGNKLKPDVMGFGGCERFPTQLISPNVGFRVYTYGTSFASPIVASTAVQLIAGSNKAIDSLVSRALIIHSTIERGNGDLLHSNLMGHGAMPDDVSTIVECPDKSYTLIYQGEVPVSKYVQYEIPWITGLVDSGLVNFRWTTAVLTDIDPSSPDDYTTSSIETTFYPNSRKYKFTNGSSSRTVDIDEQPDVVAQLLASGYQQGVFPISKSGPQPFETEGELRSNLKWDSVDYREKRIRAADIKQPMFHVHALQRGKRTAGTKVKFALILTIDAPKSNADIYSRIRTNYANLLPVNVQVQATVRVHS